MASKGLTNTYPEGWDKNVKRAVRKRPDRVIARGVDAAYKKKGKEEFFAVVLAHGQGPTTLTLDQGKMRGTPVQCVCTKENGSLSKFEEFEVQEEATTTEFLIQSWFMGVHIRGEPKCTGGPKQQPK